MKVKQLLREAILELESVYSKNEAEAMVNILAENCFGIGRQQMIFSLNKEPNEIENARFNGAIARLRNREPIQYVTGETWFYHLRFKVDRSVLIPRPETEELVEIAIKYASGKTGDMLDVGSGSGCIPISFLKNVKGWSATSIDLSTSALALAEENARNNNSPVKFIEMDFLDQRWHDELGMFDMIISNPPYIPDSEKKMLADSVTLFEPHLALFVDDPLIFYKTIAAFGRKHLNEDGVIFLEVHQHFAQETASVFEKANYSAEVIKDISGNERMVKANLNQ